MMALEGSSLDGGLMENGVFNDSNMQITCFSDESDGSVLHFQIICLAKQLRQTTEIQIYVWIGFNSARFGHLYAAAPTKPNNTASVTPLLGGAADNMGSGIARRLVLKLGLNIILACNIPKNNPIVEAQAEKLLVKKLIDLGYTKRKSESSLLQ